MKLKAIVFAAICAIALVGMQDTANAAKAKTKVKITNIGAVDTATSRALVDFQLKTKAKCRGDRKFGFFPASGGPPLTIDSTPSDGKFSYYASVGFKYELQVASSDGCKAGKLVFEVKE